MFRHNDTQDYTDAVFVAADDKFIMREARRIDASGLAKKPRQKLVDYRLEVARIRKDKEDAESNR